MVVQAILTNYGGNSDFSVIISSIKNLLALHFMTSRQAYR